MSAIEGFPANEGTEISARSLHDGVVDAIRKQQEVEQHEAEQEQLEQEQRTADIIALRKRKALALEMRGIELGYEPARA